MTICDHCRVEHHPNGATVGSFVVACGTGGTDVLRNISVMDLCHRCQEILKQKLIDACRRPPQEAN